MRCQRCTPQQVALVLALCWGLLAKSLYAQTGEQGHLLYQHYTAKQYLAETQNWAFAQDVRGVMYIGNNDGVLEFDGVHWRTIPTANHSFVGALGQDLSGRTYVGAKDELGYLRPDSLGRMTYTSLVGKLPPEVRQFKRVRNITTSTGGVCFVTQNYLFQWDGNHMAVTPTMGSLEYAAELNDQLLVSDYNYGLMRLQQGRLLPIPGGELLKESRVCGIYPTQQGPLIIFTRQKGAWTWDGKHLLAVNNPALTNYCAVKELYSTTQLTAGEFVLGTLNGGAVVVNAAGSLIRPLNKATGLQDNTVLGLFVDAEKALWLALDNGISRVEDPRGHITSFEEGQGLMGIVTAVTRHQGKVYVGTNQGLRQLAPVARQQFGSSTADVVFTPALSGLGAPVNSLLSVGGFLLVGSQEGTLALNGTQRQQLSEENTWCLLPSKLHAGRVYLGTATGVQALQLHQGRWQLLGNLGGVRGDEIRALYEDKANRLWMATSYQGVMVANLAQGFKADAPVAIYSKEQGLPSLSHNLIRPWQHGWVLLSEKGLYRYDSNTNAFHHDALLDSVLGQERPWLLDLAPLPHQGLLVQTYPIRRTLVAHQALPDPTYRPVNLSLQALYNKDITYFHPDGDSLVWLAGADGLLRLDLRTAAPTPNKFSALVRNVYLAGDSLLFAGTYFTPGGTITPYQHAYLQPELPYEGNSLRFECVATVFGEAGATEFQYWMEGFEKSWADWNPATSKQYTNLVPGHYRFHVRARNVARQVSTESLYEFTILRPWYLTWWAYTLYFIALVALFVAGVYWRVRRLQAVNAKLEKLILARTAEIAEQNGRLQGAYAQVAEKNTALNDAVKNLKATQHQLILSEKMAALGHLVDGIAHEMNTPLGAIKASVVNLQNLLPELIHGYPNWLAVQPPTRRAEFEALANWCIQHRVELSTKEERAQRKKVLALLEAAYVPDPPETARKLVELGLSERISQLLPTLQQRDSPQVMDYLHKLGRLHITLHNILAASGKTEKIVFTLKIYGRYGKTEEAVAVPLERSLNDILAIYGNHLRNQVALVQEVEPGLTVLGYPEELGQVWNNLIVNSLQAMKYRGTLTIHAYAAGTEAVVSITDTGEGISQQIAAHIFEPFFTTKPSGEGTGLGLDICKRMVEKHGGSIAYTSTPGATTFTVRIPLVNAALTAAVDV